MSGPVVHIADDIMMICIAKTGVPGLDLKGIYHELDMLMEGINATPKAREAITVLDDHVLSHTLGGTAEAGEKFFMSSSAHCFGDVVGTFFSCIISDRVRAGEQYQIGRQMVRV